MKEKLRVILLVFGLICVVGASTAIFTNVHWKNSETSSNTQTENGTDQDSEKLPGDNDFEFGDNFSDFQLDENELPLMPLYLGETENA